MKNTAYESPAIEIITRLPECDVITASPGTEGPYVEAGGGIWDLDLSN